MAKKWYLAKVTKLGNYEISSKPLPGSEEIKMDETTAIFLEAQELTDRAVGRLHGKLHNNFGQIVLLSHFVSCCIRAAKKCHCKRYFLPLPRLTTFALHPPKFSGGFFYCQNFYLSSNLNQTPILSWHRSFYRQYIIFNINQCYFQILNTHSVTAHAARHFLSFQYVFGK